MKKIVFIRAFAFAVTAALALGGTMHGALAAQSKIYADFGGGPEPLKGETQLEPAKGNWILINSARWTTSTTNVPGSWNRVPNKADKTPMQGIGSQSSGAGAGKVTLSQAAQSKLNANGLDITLNASADERTIFDLAKQARPIPVVRIDTFEVTAKGLVPVYSAALSDVLVTSVDWKGQDTDAPTAQISLKFSSVAIDENITRKKSKTPIDPTIPAGWNRVTNSNTDLTTVPIPQRSPFHPTATRPRYIVTVPGIGYKLMR